MALSSTIPPRSERTSTACRISALKKGPRLRLRGLRGRRELRTIYPKQSCEAARIGDELRPYVQKATDVPEQGGWVMYNGGRCQHLDPFWHRRGGFRGPPLALHGNPRRSAVLPAWQMSAAWQSPWLDTRREVP